MSLFVTSVPQPRAGVFAAKVIAPATIVATGFSTSVEIGQFPWGPANVEAYPSGMGQFAQVYAPAGSNRLSSAWLSVIGKAWPVLGAVRVVGTSAAAATATIKSSENVSLLTITAAYPGTTGNSITVTVGASGDGNTEHFSLTFTITGASGTTTEFYDNLNVSGTGANVLPPSIPGLGNVSVIGQVNSTVGTSVLIGSIEFVAAGLPAAGSTAFSGGTGGTVSATQYVGTPGGDDYGLALTEGDINVNNLFFDDMGSSLRPACNAGMLAHVTLMTNRMGFINGVAGQTAANAQTDVGNYRSYWLAYVDPWAQLYDDTTGAIQTQPSASFAASCAAQMPPSLSIAWRQQSAPLLGGIVGLETNRGSATAANTAAGITTLIPRVSGGFVFETDVNTSLIAGQTPLLSSRMDLYLARSVAQSWEPWVNAPNIALYQQDLLNSLNQFLNTLENNATTNPAVLPFVEAYSTPTSQGNTPAQIAAGIFQVFSTVQYGSQMFNIVFQLQSGVGVSVGSTLSSS